MIDIAFLILMAFAIYKGLRKGLIMALFSVCALFIGIVAAYSFSGTLSTYFLQQFPNQKWLPFISFLLIFTVVIILINFIGKLIEKSIKHISLGWINKLGGIALFAGLYTILFSIILYYLAQLHVFSAEQIAASKVFTVLKPLAPKTMKTIGEVIPVVKNAYLNLNNFFKK